MKRCTSVITIVKAKVSSKSQVTQPVRLNDTVTFAFRWWNAATENSYPHLRINHTQKRMSMLSKSTDKQVKYECNSVCGELQ